MTEPTNVLTNHFNTSAAKVIVLTTSGDHTEFRASNGTYARLPISNPTLDDVVQFIRERPSLLGDSWLTALVFNGTQMTQFGAHD